MATGETSWVKPVVENNTETVVEVDNGENAELKDKMRKLMESNRMLKKEIGQKDTVQSTKIEKTKRKKTFGKFKEAVERIRSASKLSKTDPDREALVANQASSTSHLTTALPPPPGVPQGSVRNLTAATAAAEQPNDGAVADNV